MPAILEFNARGVVLTIGYRKLSLRSPGLLVVNFARAFRWAYIQGGLYPWGLISVGAYIRGGLYPWGLISSGAYNWNKKKHLETSYSYTC